MKVTVSCPGRFHSFDLANQLNRYGALNRMITSYPASVAKKFGLPTESLSTLVYWEILNRGWARLARITRMNRVLLQYALCNLYDKSAASFIPPDTDFFIGWSSSSELGLKYAKQNGATTILERGSAHIEVQTELLMEEYLLYAPTKRQTFTHPAVIEKELREYEIADFISVPSSFAKNSFINKGFPEQKIIKNPYGVNLGIFNPGIKHDNVFRIIYVGQMSLQKGTHYLMEAFHSLNLKHAELILIGSKSSEIEPFFNKYKGAYNYLGHVPQIELHKYYVQSSVFILCSIQDGMGMVIIQAMACGLPIICTTNTAGEDLIENGKEGFVIPIRDIESIKEKILWLYKHQDEARQMGVAAREKVSKGFSWDTYGSRYHNFLMAQLKNS